MADVLTVVEVSKILRVSTATVYRLVHAGELDAIRLGRCLRITPAAVRALMTRGAQ